MLLGKSYHSLDQQRRLTIPKQMRAKLGEEAFITRGLDGGLFLLPNQYWEEIVNNLVKQPFTKRKARDFWRYLSNDAQQVNFDKLGRITIPQPLTEMAQLKRNVVIIGSLRYAEIWDRDTYHQYFDQVANQAEQIAEDLPWETSEENYGKSNQTNLEIMNPKQAESNL